MTSLSGIRLGFVSARSGSTEGGLWTEAGVGRLLDVWRRECRQLTVALSLAPQRKIWHDHRLDASLVDFRPLPWLPSIARGFHKAPACRRVIRDVEKQSDVVIVQLPFAAPLALLRPHKPRLYHVCADVYQIASTSPWYRGVTRMVAVSVARGIDRLYRRLLAWRGARVVTNGEDLWQHYRPQRGRAVVSSSLSRDEIMSVRRTRPADSPLRLLFVGYLRHEKGIDTLCTAYERVLDCLPSAELCFVGSENMVDRGMSEDVRRRLEELSERGNVQFLGHRAFGPELFQCFADADVLAVPSRSEGTPRVLVEARAFGCTVVASRVGGIPTSVEDEVDGLLVPPDDSAALADALLRIGRDAALKKRLIENGICRAQKTTVESFAEAMAEEAAACLTAA